MGLLHLISGHESWVIRGNPVLDLLLELLSLLTQFGGLGLAHDVGDVVVKHVSFSSAEFEVSHEVGNTRTYGKLGGLEADLMVTLTDDTVAGAGDGHLRRLKCGVVGRGERTVGGEAGDPRVAKVTLDHRA